MMNSRDEVVLALTDDIDTDEPDSGHFNASTRRWVLAGHFLFRFTAILIYLFCSWFTSSFVLPFVFILINLSLDFWFVKNISGRVLVGLRWSSYTDETGSLHWRFDSRPSPVSSIESDDTATLTRRELAARSARSRAGRMFWIGLVAAPVVWGLLVLAAVFSLKLRWALVAVMGVSMTAVNLYAYIRCRLSGSSGEAGGSSTVGLGAFSSLQSKVTRQFFSDFWSSMKPTGVQQKSAVNAGFIGDQSNSGTSSATMVM